MQCRCPLSGVKRTCLFARTCSLLGVKQTSQTDAVMSANDPKADIPTVAGWIELIRTEHAGLANGYGLYEYLAIVAEIGIAGAQKSVDLLN